MNFPKFLLGVAALSPAVLFAGSFSQNFEGLSNNTPDVAINVVGNINGSNATGGTVISNKKETNNVGAYNVGVIKTGVGTGATTALRLAEKVTSSCTGAMIIPVLDAATAQVAEFTVELDLLLDKSVAPAIPADGFKVEWVGKIQVPDPKRLTFQAEADDNLEIFIDGKSVVQFNQGTRERRFSGKVEENRWYDFRAVYREDGGEAKAILKWEADKLPSQIIPPTRFRTFSGEADETGRESSLASFPVKGPDGKPRVAQA